MKGMQSQTLMLIPVQEDSGFALTKPDELGKITYAAKDVLDDTNLNLKIGDVIRYKKHAGVQTVCDGKNQIIIYVRDINYVI